MPTPGAPDGEWKGVGGAEDSGAGDSGAGAVDSVGGMPLMDMLPTMAIRPINELQINEINWMLFGAGTESVELD